MVLWSTLHSVHCTPYIHAPQHIRSSTLTLRWPIITMLTHLRTLNVNTHTPLNGRWMKCCHNTMQAAARSHAWLRCDNRFDCKVGACVQVCAVFLYNGMINSHITQFNAFRSTFLHGFTPSTLRFYAYIFLCRLRFFAFFSCTCIYLYCCCCCYFLCVDICIFFLVFLLLPLYGLISN